MSWIVAHLWLVPAIPVLAAAGSALMKHRRRTLAGSLAIGSMSVSFLLSVWAFVHVLRLHDQGIPTLEVVKFRWFRFGSDWLTLGWILDPLTSVMLLMVTFVGLLIFIYSASYMAHDDNFARFFCFLALFAGAMLGVILSNSLLLLFMCWEIVGLTSYLLIGFWYGNPRAAAAARKAFLVTRIGDLAFFLGMMWLYAKTGTLLFYDQGLGCMEPTALSHLATLTTTIGLGASTAIALLIFFGAAGKSGQVPLHVWLPDAMEGPTPVSALIHAATMVAAGVFLIARIYPLMSLHQAGTEAMNPTTALQVVTWVGAITAVFGASIAVAQYDIKRILAYSTISQLGYMMMGLGAGGVAVGIFHLITHAFFKSLLFLGAGSVIHGCEGEQDIRRMGGLRTLMPVTFAAYAAGMLALCGFPLFFSGFWSKDEILHAAHNWGPSQMPFYLGTLGALLTSFYMTRQVYYVFGGRLRTTEVRDESLALSDPDYLTGRPPYVIPHESGPVMTLPLVILAAFAILLGLLGTPAWPWLQSFLDDQWTPHDFGRFLSPGLLPVMALSSAVVLAGLGLGWWFYGREPIGDVDSPDNVGRLQPSLFRVLNAGYYVDAIYGATLIRLNDWFASTCDWLDRKVWSDAARMVSLLVVRWGSLDNLLDGRVVNAVFDEGCHEVSHGGRILSLLQDGRTQSYLRAIGGALVVFALFLLWGARA